MSGGKGHWVITAQISLPCAQETCAVAMDDTYLYRDTDQLSPNGVKKISRQVERILSANKLAGH